MDLHHRHRIHTAKLPSARLKTLFLVLFSLSIFCFLLLRRSSSPPLSLSSTTPTSLSHLLFSISSSSSSLPRRHPLLSLWLCPSIRAVVFVDSLPDNLTAGLPSLVVSEPTSRFPYSFPGGRRTAVRGARVVKEAVDRNEVGVRWFVFGDDDTVFFPENLVGVLGKYDHEKLYYIGSVSESVEQNQKMGFEMAYGGGGFAISSGLARVLGRVFDSCLMRYPHLYGSDARVSACVAELGVGLTREPGFHQVDVRGDLFGLLTASPLSPLLSLHHFDAVKPIFPNMDHIQALQHLFKAANVDPPRILQQSVCYDRANNLTVSVAWGYAIQVYEGNQLLLDLLSPLRTFTPWRRRGSNNMYQYVFNTRDYPKNLCKRPAVFFLDSVVSRTGRIWSDYRKNITGHCSRADVIEDMERIRVFTKKLEHDWKAPRRQCCDISHPSSKSMVIEIRQCGEDELISMNV